MKNLILSLAILLICLSSSAQNTFNFELERVGPRHRLRQSIVNSEVQEIEVTVHTILKKDGFSVNCKQGEHSFDFDVIDSDFLLTNNNLPPKDHFVFKTPGRVLLNGFHTFHNIEIEAAAVENRGVLKAFKANITTDYIYNPGAIHLGYKGVESDVDLPYLYWLTPSRALREGRAFQTGLIHQIGGEVNPLNGWIVADEGLDVMGMKFSDTEKLRVVGKMANKSLFKKLTFVTGPMLRE